MRPVKPQLLIETDTARKTVYLLGMYSRWGPEFGLSQYRQDVACLFRANKALNLKTMKPGQRPI